ncbi:hypothetical protein [Legionella maioricensis]|nr:hypothetical protein [Legionella maioricensis]
MLDAPNKSTIENASSIKIIIQNRINDMKQEIEQAETLSDGYSS